jgi:hypothetical protein
LNKQVLLQPGWENVSFLKYKLFVINKIPFEKEGLEDQEGMQRRLQEIAFEKGRWIKLA